MLFMLRALPVFRRYFFVLTFLTFLLYLRVTKVQLRSHHALAFVTQSPLHLLNQFGPSEYKQVQGTAIDFLPDNACLRVTQLKPRFLICPYQPSEDSQVSAAYWSDDPWEVELSVVIGLALTKYPKAVFVDIGAGIGSHALYAAAQRRKTIAVEALLNNVVRLYRAAVASNLQNRLRIFHNAVDDQHHLVNLGLVPNDAAATYVTNEPSDLQVEAVTLKEVLAAASTESKEAVMKIDINSLECRAITGSANVFKQQRQPFIPYVFMEWNFNYNVTGSPQKSDNCKEQLLAEMTSVFLGNNYIPYGANPNPQVDRSRFKSKVDEVYHVPKGILWARLKTSEFSRWKRRHVVWVHKTAVPLKLLSVRRGRVRRRPKKGGQSNVKG